MPPNLISEFWPTKVDHFSRKTLFLPKFHSLSYHLGSPPLFIYIIAPRAINISLQTPNRSPKLTFQVKFRGVGGLPIKILLFWTYHHDLCSKCLSCFGVFRKIRALFIFTICRAWPAENDSPSPSWPRWLGDSWRQTQHAMLCTVSSSLGDSWRQTQHAMLCTVSSSFFEPSEARDGVEKVKTATTDHETMDGVLAPTCCRDTDECWWLLLTQCPQHLPIQYSS